MESIEYQDGNLSQPSEEEIKKIVTAILSYHTLPERLGLFALSQNTTYPTILSHVFGALDNNAIRLRVGAGLPFVKVNFYSDIVKPNFDTTNGMCFVVHCLLRRLINALCLGVIHVIDKPLLPPPSVFQSIFLFQQTFATFVSNCIFMTVKV